MVDEGHMVLHPIARQAARNVAGMTGKPISVQDYTQDALLWCITHPERVQRCTSPDVLGWELVGHLLRRVDAEFATPKDPEDDDEEDAPGVVGGRVRGGVLRRLPAVWLPDWAPPSTDPPGMPRGPSDAHSSMNPTVDRLALLAAVRELSAASSRVLGLRVVGGYTEAEIGDLVGLSRQRVHQVLVEAAEMVVDMVEGGS